jgi:adenosylhomocysteinase
MSFADQALVAEWIQKNEDLKAGVYDVPRDIDEMVSRIKLQSMGVMIDKLTDEQRRYLTSWSEGTV